MSWFLQRDSRGSSVAQTSSDLDSRTTDLMLQSTLQYDNNTTQHIMQTIFYFKRILNVSTIQLKLDLSYIVLTSLNISISVNK